MARERIEAAISRNKASPQPELPRCNPEENADLLVAADPYNAAAVWRALGERLACSMTVLLLAWHGIPIPDNPILFPARAPGWSMGNLLNARIERDPKC